MYVPLHTVMAVYLQHKQLPKTITQLYMALVETILSQHVDDHPEYCSEEEVYYVVLDLNFPKQFMLTSQSFVKLRMLLYAGKN